MKEWTKKDGEALREKIAMRFPNLSIRKVAEAVGIDQANLARVLRGEMAPSDTMLQKLRAAGVFEKNGAEGLKLFRFDRDDSPAWDFTVQTVVELYRYRDRPLEEKGMKAEELGVEYFDYQRFVEAVAIFSLLANKLSRAVLRAFLLTLSSFQSEEELIHWLVEEAGRLPEADMRRIIFHAFCFALDPVAYVSEGGILRIDRAFWFQDPDSYLSVPSFAVKLVAKFASEKSELEESEESE